MRSVLITFLLVHCALVCAQTGIPKLPSSGSSFSAFIPERWVPLDTAVGDLNNDERDDAVLVLQCRDTIMGDTTGMGSSFSPAAPRTLTVLFGTPYGYRLALQNDHFILRSNEGGMFDPFEGVEIKDGLLVIYFYGGSAWRFSYTYNFRFTENVFSLVGAEALDYYVPEGYGSSYSFDFRAHRVKVTTGNMTEQEESNTTHEEDIPPLPLHTFDTFVRPFTWRINDDLTL